MNTIITIGREYGSAGHTIGKKLASVLNIPYYDKELMARAAKDSGLCEEVFEHHDERPTSSFLYNLVMDTYSFGYNMASFNDMPISHKVFVAQFDAIKKIADEGACVIVGRCADYALSDRDNVLKVFIHADLDYRTKRIAEIYNLTLDKARDKIIKTDKSRASYYNYYSTNKWGNSDTYDLSINSAVLGIDGTVDFLKSFVEQFENK